jgi:hypothetical protein
MGKGGWTFSGGATSGQMIRSTAIMISTRPSPPLG